MSGVVLSSVPFGLPVYSGKPHMIHMAKYILMIFVWFISGECKYKLMCYKCAVEKS